MAKKVIYTAAILVGVLTVNYWIKQGGIQDTVIGCWHIAEPFVGLCI